MSDGGLTSILERLAIGTVAITTRSISAVGQDLTLTQWRVIVLADERPSGVPISELATRTGASLSAMSRLVRRMVRAGLLERADDPGDRRVTLAILSERGRSVREAVLAHRRELLGSVAASVGTPPPDELAFLDGLARELARLG